MFATGGRHPRAVVSRVELLGQIDGPGGLRMWMRLMTVARGSEGEEGYSLLFHAEEYFPAMWILVTRESGGVWVADDERGEGEPGGGR